MAWRFSPIFLTFFFFFGGGDHLPTHIPKQHLDKSENLDGGFQHLLRSALPEIQVDSCVMDIFPLSF